MTDTELDSSVAALRALLVKDIDTAGRLRGELDSDGRRAYAVLLGTAFSRAVNRRFRGHHTNADIIEFVAEARARYPRTGEMVGAEDAERVIRAALGENHLIDTLDWRSIGAAQTAVLFALVHEDNDGLEEVDALLAGAAADAAAYLRRRAGR